MNFFDLSITYAELAAAAERLAGHLSQMGVGRGDRVLVMMQNCPQLVIAHYAIARANAVAVPVNPMSKSEELWHYISNSQCVVAITTGDLAAELARADPRLLESEQLSHLIVSQFPDVVQLPNDATPIPAQWRPWLSERYAPPKLARGKVHDWQDLVQTEATPPKLSDSREELALLPFTSGTTGLPKGCMLTHANVLHNALTTTMWLSLTSDSTTLAAVPMFHITGLVCIMHATIFAGGQLVIMPRWDRSLARYMMREFRVSHWTCIPAMIVDFLADPELEQSDLSSLRYVGGGGSAMPEPVAQELLDLCGLRFVEGYGLTETSAVTLLNPCDAPKLQCLGLPFISVDARILDIDSNEERPSGEVGEIVLSGPQVFQGYWRNEDATNSAFTRQNGTQYFRTGDIGYRDGDGYFFITDRAKRMINASGYKVWPAELEGRLYRHPGIQEACVIGVADAYRGENVKALIVRRTSHLALTEEDVIGWCREQMSAYKVPRIVQFVETLPKGASGKILWRQLQDAERKR